MLAKRRLLSLFFPRNLRCAICGEGLAWDEEAICRECAEGFHWEMRCQEMESLTAVYAASAYDEGLRKAILAFKYRNRRYMACFFALALRDFPHEEGEILLPVPIHPLRRKERGFCQTTEICGELARLTGLKLEKAALRRVRNTPSQTALDAQARRENLLGAFAADPQKVGGKRCILVDDVVTTGATMRECAAALKAAGAVSVTGWAVATTVTGSMSPPQSG